MSTTRILIVDDDIQLTELLNDVLEDSYAVSCSNTGEKAIEDYKTLKPDIIILDIGLGEMSGFDVCRAIKQLDTDSQSSVIFFSGHNNNEERIKAYEVGGDDYIAKPFLNKELLAKIELIDHFQKDKKSSREQEQLSRSVAFQSMQEASEYGAIVQFIKETFSITDTKALFNKLFGYLSNLNLECCIYYTIQDECAFYRPNFQPCSPIEKELFTLLKSNGRIFDFNNRTIFNDKHISILVKNMPTDDPTIYGRDKDILAAILECIEARLIEIEHQHALNNFVCNIGSVIESINTEFQQHDRNSMKIMDDLIFEMQGAIAVIDLSIEQEDHFMKIVGFSMRQLAELYADSRKIDAIFDDLIIKCDQLITR